MHRSGTSALTGVLQKLGVALGEELLPPSRDNPKGYFENAAVVAVHESLFSTLSRTWQDPRPMPPRWRESAAADQAHASLTAVICDLFQKADVVAVKDPRTSRVVSLWEDVARGARATLGAALVVRHPDEVAGSLRKRDGLSRARAHLLWMTYLLEAERDTRSLARAFVSYEGLLADWRVTLARMRSSGLDRVIPEPASAAALDIDAFLDVTLRRNESAGISAPSSFEALALELYGLALRCVAGQVVDVPAAFDAVALRLAPLAAQYFDAPLQLEQELERQRHDQARIDASMQLAALRELWRPALPARPPGAARLYYRRESEEFSEASAVPADPQVEGARRDVVFELPADATFDYLRMDPDGAPGVYAIESILIDGAPLADVADRLRGVHEFPLPVTRLGDVARFAALGEDPHFVVDVRGIDRSASPNIAVRFRFETVLSEVGGYLDDHRDVLHSAGAALAQQQSQLVAAVETLVAQQRLTDDALAQLPNISARQHELASSLLAQADVHAQATGAGFAALQAELTRLQEQQAHLLAWVRRPWWSRIFGARSFADSLHETRSLHALANVEDCGGGVWRSVNDDPQFLVSDDALRLPAGRYLFEAVAKDVVGTLVSPCLYPDSGAGFSEDARIRLPEWSGGNSLLAVIEFRDDVERLRFDPSTRAANFELSSVTLRRLEGRDLVMTMARLAGRQAGGQAGWREVVAAFLRELWSGGSTAGEDAAFVVYRRMALPHVDDDYGFWVERHGTLSSLDIAQLGSAAEGLARKPLVSILCPLGGADDASVARTIESAIGQLYPHWELCVTGRSRLSSRAARRLDAYIERDRRIRLVGAGHLENSAAASVALDAARGEYVTSIKPGDVMRVDALLEMVSGLNANAHWRLLYSDEDSVDADGWRSAPFFKPDWNYELFLAQNYFGRLTMYETALVRSTGGFRPDAGDAQAWDLGLRCIESLQAAQIGHVSRVLIHCAEEELRPQAAGEDGLRAVAAHLSRTGQRARLELDNAGHVRVLRESASLPKVSLLIPTRDRVDLLRTCVQSILERTDYPDYEILVIDNQSSEPATLAYFESLEAEPRVRVLAYDAPFNYSAVNNFAAEHATGSVLGLVNNDIEVITPEWMRQMVAQAMRPEVGAVGAMLLYPDDTIQHAGVVLGIGGVAGHAYPGLPADAAGQRGRAQLAQEMSAVTAACLLVRKSVFDEVGGLDPTLVVAFNDVDLCIRILDAGYRNIWTPYARLYHHESASRGYENTPEKVARFNGESDRMRARWGQALLGDPAYNCNLTLTAMPFDPAFPPREPSTFVPGRVGQWREAAAKG